MSSFIIFCQANQLNWVDEASLDVCVCELFGQMFLNGHGGEEGSKYLAALAFFLPDVSRMGPFSLPRATRAIRGWTKSAPGHQRLPLPCVLLCPVVGVLQAAQRTTMALALWLSFRAYLRPGECSSLTHRQLVEPVPSAGSQYRFWGLWLSLDDRNSMSRPGKTGLWNEAISLDQDPWLDPLLRPLATAGDPSEPLWPFSGEEFSATFKRIMKRLGLDHLDQSLHCLRHGGASEDLLGHLRSAAAVKRRGPWRSDSSLRRYGKERQGDSTSKRAEQCVSESPSVRPIHGLLDRELLSEARHSSRTAKPKRPRLQPLSARVRPLAIQVPFRSGGDEQTVAAQLPDDQTVSLLQRAFPLLHSRKLSMIGVASS